MVQCEHCASLDTHLDEDWGYVYMMEVIQGLKLVVMKASEFLKCENPVYVYANNESVDKYIILNTPLSMKDRYCKCPVNDQLSFIRCSNSACNSVYYDDEHIDAMIVPEKGLCNECWEYENNLGPAPTPTKLSFCDYCEKRFPNPADGVTWPSGFTFCTKCADSIRKPPPKEEELVGDLNRGLSSLQNHLVTDLTKVPDFRTELKQEFYRRWLLKLFRNKQGLDALTSRVGPLSTIVSFCD